MSAEGNPFETPKAANDNFKKSEERVYVAPGEVSDDEIQRRPVLTPEEQREIELKEQRRDAEENGKWDFKADVHRLVDLGVSPEPIVEISNLILSKNHTLLNQILGAPNTLSALLATALMDLLEEFQKVTRDPNTIKSYEATVIGICNRFPGAKHVYSTESES